MDITTGRSSSTAQLASACLTTTSTVRRRRSVARVDVHVVTHVANNFWGNNTGRSFEIGANAWVLAEDNYSSNTRMPLFNKTATALETIKSDPTFAKYTSSAAHPLDPEQQVGQSSGPSSSSSNLQRRANHSTSKLLRRAPSRESWPYKQATWRKSGSIRLATSVLASWTKELLVQVRESRAWLTMSSVSCFLSYTV
ncbi:unnamed protein product [Phytophthora fragariaefolia]|uniref:Unnamed protein product n=1 Tax=Phytophthora fragariaefolia TaxID=1490495 RepID=A0A9W7CFI3_9STRA|nr:unnamed protein product [Phytophthora fragariaefolia]